LSQQIPQERLHRSQFTASGAEERPFQQDCRIGWLCLLAQLEMLFGFRAVAIEPSGAGSPEANAPGTRPGPQGNGQMIACFREVVARQTGLGGPEVIPSPQMRGRTRRGPTQDQND
jgi:hypothetical protein